MDRQLNVKKKYSEILFVWKINAAIDVRDERQVIISSWEQYYFLSQDTETE